jgi:hypothetical protein
MKTVFITACLIASALCDTSSYGAPSAPSAPSAGYDAGGYDYSAGYDQVAYEQDDGGLDLGKLEELLPLFIAVFAAIILAQLLAPLFTGLIALLVGILPGALGLKAPIINALLAPLGLQLCTTAVPPVAFTGRSFTSRAFTQDLLGGKFSEDQINIMTDFAESAINSLTSQFGQ